MRRPFGVDYELCQLLANVSKSMETYTNNIYTIKHKISLHQKWNLARPIFSNFSTTFVINFKFTSVKRYKVKSLRQISGILRKLLVIV